MNTENMQQSRAKLEKLSAEQQSYLVDLSRHGTLEVMVDALKENGIETSESAVGRCLRKRRAADLVEERKELAGSVEALAEQGRGGKLREGTLEVMRQNF